MSERQQAKESTDNSKEIIGDDFSLVPGETDLGIEISEGDDIVSDTLIDSDDDPFEDVSYLDQYNKDKRLPESQEKQTRTESSVQQEKQQQQEEQEQRQKQEQKKTEMRDNRHEVSSQLTANRVQIPQEIEGIESDPVSEKHTVEQNGQRRMQAQAQTQAQRQQQSVLSDKLTELESDLKETFENGLNPISREIYSKRYQRGEETPFDVLRRVAYTLSHGMEIGDLSKTLDIDTIYYEFLTLMATHAFLPNSPTLMNAGKYIALGTERRPEQLAACFVLPVPDDLVGIFDALKHQAIIHQSGGGTGFSFSRLRQKNATVKSSGGVASGPVSFMRVFNQATDVIKQGGTRRGANMAILSIDHPDIEEFITIKNNLDEMTNFNISVAITDKFMRALNSESMFALKDPRNGKTVKEVSAVKLFRLLVDSAWKTGEPGVVFIDQINKYNPTPHLGKIEATNPCGEQPLLPYDACNLGSINVTRFVKIVSDDSEDDTTNSRTKTKTIKILDEKKLSNTVYNATFFLNAVIDSSDYPVPEIEEMVHRIRRIGLGIMGFADLLIELDIAYDSEEARSLGKRIMKILSDSSYHASVSIAASTSSYPEQKVYDPYKGVAIRNAARLTIAPTGSISILAGCSGGIEPLYALAFWRRHQDGEIQMPDINQTFIQTAKRHGFWSERFEQALATVGSIQIERRPELKEKLIDNGYSDMVKVFEKIPSDIKKVWVTSHDISPKHHLYMQAAFQEYTDNAVSKTINMPESTDSDGVFEIFKKAYDTGCKGVTIYRDGSREGQVLSFSTTAKDKRKNNICTCDDPNLVHSEGCVSCLNCRTSQCDYITPEIHEHEQTVEKIKDDISEPAKKAKTKVKKTKKATTSPKKATKISQKVKKTTTRKKGSDTAKKIKKKTTNKKGESEQTSLNS